MSKIRQADIYPGSVSFTKAANFSVTIGVSYVQSNLTATAYSLGTVSGMASTDPIAIKDFGTSSITTWADEQDWTVYNKSFTTTIPVSNVAGGVAIYTTSTNASISNGDLVGIYGPGSWATSGVLSIAKRDAAGAGSQSAGLVAGGLTSGTTNVTELFNGSSWLTSGALNLARSSGAGAGSQSAGLVAGGLDASSNVVTTTDLFNGSSWATSGTLSVAKRSLAGAGSQSAGLVAGGNTGGSGVVNATELFNGSSWSIISVNLNTARGSLAGFGSQSGCVVVGGQDGSGNNVTTTELFNGSSWNVSGWLSVAKTSVAGAGSETAGLIAGGITGATTTNVTELFNGSSWSASGNLSVAKGAAAGAGSQGVGLIAGGTTTARTNSTELHTQTLYRKIVNFNELKSARSVGVAFDVTSTTLSVKFNGFINNINVTSSNSSITTAAQWINNWVVLSRFNPNASTTNNPSSVIVKNSIEAEDYLVGWAISQTQMQVFAGNIFNRDKIGGW